MSTLSDLIEKAKNLTTPEPISGEQVKIAWNDRYIPISNREEAFYFLCAVNLLNAAIKRKAFKKEIHYGGIKKPLALFLMQLIETNGKYVDDFYMNPEEGPCLYVETFGLQFTFHNVNAKEEAIQNFMDSDRNHIKDWRGIRLQWIAGELFEIGLEMKRQ
ncbi:hypothetical protein [Robertkochia flava]|uniref:hypothetical protein n=1 Tax=Robertkochia flava TaxID=3447986 RepID=UPI001CCB6137|nr:hypothetical protein [Robertkochia marina]